MKATRYLIAALVALCFNTLLSFGQAGMIRTIAGGGTSTADGIPATAAQFASTFAIWTDAHDNVYFSDRFGCKIKKINAVTGVVTTVAGTGVSGNSGDGGPATNARISGVKCIRLDGFGNLYLEDYWNRVIKKVDAVTGIITTVVGGSTGPTTDGSSALNAVLGPCLGGFHVDAVGNIYIYDNKIRKVDASTNLLSTVAGGGTSTADGIPATNAQVGAVTHLLTDNAGNLYFYSNTLRKIDNAGIITTIAGGGTSTADGVPATSCLLNYPATFSIDPLGNIVLIDSLFGRIRRIDKNTGIMTIIAGGGTLPPNNVPVLNADLAGCHFIHINNSGNIYITRAVNPLVCKINDYPTLPAITSDSLSVSVTQYCNGPKMTVFLAHNIPSRSVKTYFGDGGTDSSNVLPGVFGGSYIMASHSYSASGPYTIKHVLFDGSIAEDSVSYNFNYDFCRTLPIKLYADANGNCTKDTLESFYQHPSLVRVDSNNIAVDTLSAISGFSYNAYSNAGDIYTFRVISTPGGISATCPSIGYIADTIQSTVSSYAPKYFGLSCIAPSYFDASIHAEVYGSGVHEQDGTVFVSNSACLPVNAHVVVHFDPRYIFTAIGSAFPAASSYTSNSITWDLPGLSADNIGSGTLSYTLRNNPATGYLVAGDTVRTYVDITPVAGDANPSNNSINILDTVRASYDPNFIKVLPAGCITSGTLPTQLQYTIHFENTGTDTAHNIYVLDTLPAYVNPNTLRILMASAAMDIDIQRHDGYSVVRFDFPNINLLDTSHHGECDAAFIYTINTNAGLVDGTDIMNRVGIYFDYNSVVMTNEAHNNIGGCWPTTVATVKSNTSALPYPNPVTDLLHIDVVTPAQYTISNIVGKPVQQGQLQAGSNTLQVGTLPGGVYLVSLVDKDGVRLVYKIVKE